MRTHHFVLTFLVLGLALPAVAELAPAAEAPLSFAERVACQEKIEDVYWAHRIWPETNPGAKPTREEVLNHSQIVAKVEKQLLVEAALIQFWGESLGETRVQAELDRIVRSSRNPKLLADVFAALDGDPRRIAECYVRPRFVERLVREHYAWDREIHGELRRKAEMALLEGVSPASLRLSGIPVTETTFVQQETPAPTAEADEIALGPDDWETTVHQVASRVPSSLSDPMERLAQRVGLGFSPVHEEADAFVAIQVLEVDQARLRVAAATWTKTSFEKWLRGIAPDVTPSPHPIGRYTLPKLKTYEPCLDDTWQPTASGPPTARTSVSGVWTGSEYLIWGGANSVDRFNSGARYDPATDTWTEINPSGAPSKRAQPLVVWTGNEMIVWGGIDGTNYPTTGGRYNPTTDTWTPTSTTAVPVGRYHTSAVWTGTAMFFWGGWNANEYLALPNNGGLYNPATDTWTAPTTSGGPGYRQLHVTEWTGTKVIIWGGWYGSALNTGRLYDPTTNSWTSTTTSGAPSSRYYTASVWTGSEMIVWGGYNGSSAIATGGRYDPTANSWTTITTTGAPPAVYTHGAVWTGDEMIVWGGANGSDYVNTGGRYDPTENSWTATSIIGAPSARGGHGVVWTGSEMVTWGGSIASGVSTNTGGRYDPVDDSWTPTFVGAAPSARFSHSAVWTGSELVVWGGYDVADLDSGSRYDPASDSWTATSMLDVPAARRAHTAIWSGTEMIVWGGVSGGTSVATGGRYAPAGDTWTATPTAGAPSARYGCPPIWTGTEMILWGGRGDSNYFGDGGLYLPSLDSWGAITPTAAPEPRAYHSAVWSGDEMIVWGGQSSGGAALGNGGVYDPVSDTWVATASNGAPDSRYNHTAVWSGDTMILWGGFDGSSALADGSVYDPDADDWTPTTASDAPDARYTHSAVWAGDELILWGGQDANGVLDTGGRYNPGLDSWTSTSLSSAPYARYSHSATWLDGHDQMVVWGGYSNGAALQSGGLYCASGYLGMDFGDAADPTYPTLLASDGARHQLWGELYLGSTVDAEDDGHPDIGAQGDDNDGVDDEDGVVKPAYFYAGASTPITVTASAAGYLNVWIDHHKDGDWYDPGEQVLTDYPVNAGANNLEVVLPLNASTGATAMRVRLSSVGGLTPTGLALDGEVEDYTLSIEPTAELALVIADSHDPVVEGRQLSYTLGVTNNGQAAATGVVLTTTLPGEVSFVSAAPGEPTCSESAGIVSCQLGSVAAASSTQVDIVVEVNAGTSGSISCSAALVLDQSDPVTANNSASQDTTVLSLLIFADDFEDGDLLDWSSSAP